ncbi:hypothetical protein M0R04_12165 [Candidatus Dojkabacteria bacterium]|jgi:hypothetical protein|nr:hypothetical protein [Candidatus Dojkabacteria bacterium]
MDKLIKKLLIEWQEISNDKEIELPIIREAEDKCETLGSYEWEAEQLVFTKDGRTKWIYISGCSCDDATDYGEFIGEGTKKSFEVDVSKHNDLKKKIIEALTNRIKKIRSEREEYINTKRDLETFSKERPDIDFGGVCASGCIDMRSPYEIAQDLIEGYEKNIR